MKGAALTLTLDSESLFQDLVDRLQLARAAEDWSQSANDLNAFEDEYLFIPEPAQ